VYRRSRHRCRRPTPAAYSRCFSRRRAGWLPQRRRRSSVRCDEWPPVGGW